LFLLQSDPLGLGLAKRVAEELAVEIVVYGPKADLEGLDGDEAVDYAFVRLTGGLVLLLKSAGEA
jgi:hypothetical protein